MIKSPNISTEHQPKGSARNMSDTLEKRPEEKPEGTAEPLKRPQPGEGTGRGKAQP